MSFPYEGPSNNLRLRVRPSTHNLEKMDDLPVKPERKPSTPPAKASAVKKQAAPKETWEEREKAAKAKVNRAQQASANTKKQSSAKTHAANEKLLKNTPAFREHQHPRDRFGRFAVKAIKATGRAIKGTVKGIHKTVKRANTIARRNDALRHRERKLDLHKREQAAGIGRKRRAPRKKATPAKKQGGLFGFLRGSKKKRVRRKR